MTFCSSFHGLRAKKNPPSFGITMDGRSITRDAYRYGFQGQEKDDQIKGAGNSLNYTFRMHDPRIGRFFAVDMLEKKYPRNSPYAFSQNIVINAIELEGLEAFYVHGMGGSPEQWNDENFKAAALEFFKFTNNSSYDNKFDWRNDKNGRHLNGPAQTHKDREIAANMLVEHVLAIRKEKIDAGEITKDEEITLIGFSAGGLVSMQAAEILADQGYKVNIIAVNPPAKNYESSDEHPAGNKGINDMLIFYTEGDKLSRTLWRSSHKFKKGSVDEKFQEVEIKSKSKMGVLKHFVKNLIINSIGESGAKKLDQVPDEYKNGETSGDSQGKDSSNEDGSDEN